MQSWTNTRKPSLDWPETTFSKLGEMQQLDFQPQFLFDFCRLKFEQAFPRYVWERERTSGFEG